MPVKCDDNLSIGDVERLLIGTQHDSIGAEILAKARHLAGRIDVVGTAHGEIHTADLVGDEVVETSQRPAFEFVRQDPALRREDTHRGRLGTWRCTGWPAGIRASPLRCDDATSGVHR